MALLGARKPTFGQIPQQMTALQAYGDGSTPAMMQQPQQPQQEEPRFKPNILGVIGDAMQVFGGGQATYMQGVQEQQQRAAMMRERAMAAQAQEETSWRRFIKENEYKRANPEAPDTPSNVRTALWYQNATDEQKKAFREANPIVSYMADGTPRVIDPSMMGKPSGPQPGTIEDGHEFIGGDPKNPASWKKVGGSGGNVTGGFR